MLKKFLFGERHGGVFIELHGALQKKIKATSSYLQMDMGVVFRIPFHFTKKSGAVRHRKKN